MFSRMSDYLHFMKYFCEPHSYYKICDPQSRVEKMEQNKVRYCECKIVEFKLETVTLRVMYNLENGMCE